MMLTRPFLLHALSPLHAGTGQAVGVIDLPIARMKATGIPYLPGSSIKGVLRDAQTDRGDGFLAAFGPEPTAVEPDHFAGALAFGDARLLLLPVRSLRGTFAWVTSPLLLRLADQDGAGLSRWTHSLGEARAVTSTTTVLAGAGEKVFLEEIDLQVEEPESDSDRGLPVPQGQAAAARRMAGVAPARTAAATLAGELSAWLFKANDDAFTKRFCIVDDETMTFLWETATQVDARNRIGDNGVVAKGQLWWEESLPAETVLIGLASATKSRKSGYEKGAADFLTMYLRENEKLQFGGKSTVGRGRVRLLPVKEG